jgi:hypothetical protein
MVPGASMSNTTGIVLSSRIPFLFGIVAAIYIFAADIFTYTMISYYIITEGNNYFFGYLAIATRIAFYGATFVEGWVNFLLPHIFGLSYLRDHYGSYVVFRILCDVIFGFLQWYWIGRLIIWVRTRMASR